VWQRGDDAQSQKKICWIAKRIGAFVFQFLMQWDCVKLIVAAVHHGDELSGLDLCCRHAAKRANVSPPDLGWPSFEVALMLACLGDSSHHLAASGFPQRSRASTWRLTILVKLWMFRGAKGLCCQRFRSILGKASRKHHADCQTPSAQTGKRCPHPHHQAVVPQKPFPVFMLKRQIMSSWLSLIRAICSMASPGCKPLALSAVKPCGCPLNQSPTPAQASASLSRDSACSGPPCPHFGTLGLHQGRS
jgi:hypothetical protein